MKRAGTIILIAISAGLLVGFVIGPRTCVEVYRYDPSVRWTACGYKAAQINDHTQRLPAELDPPIRVISEFTDVGEAAALGALTGAAVLLLSLAPGIARRYLAEVDGTQSSDFSRSIV